jgi:hypothetical protein
MNEFLLLAVVMIYVAISYRPTRNPERRRSQSHLLDR